MPENDQPAAQPPAVQQPVARRQQPLPAAAPRGFGDGQMVGRATFFKPVEFAVEGQPMAAGMGVFHVPDDASPEEVEAAIRQHVGQNAHRMGPRALEAMLDAARTHQPRAGAPNAEAHVIDLTEPEAIEMHRRIVGGPQAAEPIEGQVVARIAAEPVAAPQPPPPPPQIAAAAVPRPAPPPAAPAADFEDDEDFHL